MQQQNSRDSNFILNRLHAALKIRQNQELARYLGVEPSTLSSWRKRNIVDYGLIVDRVRGVNLHWLFTGEGEPFLNGTNGDEQAGGERRRYLVTESEIEAIRDILRRVQENQ